MVKKIVVWLKRQGAPSGKIYCGGLEVTTDNYKYTKCRKCGWSITANDIDQCSKCFVEQTRNEPN